MLPLWEDLFAYVTKRAAGEPFFLVLDECPYLTGVSDALTSIVQRFWDHDWADAAAFVSSMAARGAVACGNPGRHRAAALSPKRCRCGGILLS